MLTQSTIQLIILFAQILSFISTTIQCFVPHPNSTFIDHWFIYNYGSSNDETPTLSQERRCSLLGFFSFFLGYIAGNWRQNFKQSAWISSSASKLNKHALTCWNHLGSDRDVRFEPRVRVESRFNCKLLCLSQVGGGAVVFMSSSVPGEVRPARAHLLPGLMPLPFVFAFTLRLSPNQMCSTARMQNFHFSLWIFAEFGRVGEFFLCILVNYERGIKFWVDRQPCVHDLFSVEVLFRIRGPCVSNISWLPPSF